MTLDRDAFPALAASYLMAALLRLDARVLSGTPDVRIQLLIPLAALPDELHGEVCEITVVCKAVA